MESVLIAITILALCTTRSTPSELVLETLSQPLDLTSIGNLPCDRLRGHLTQLVYQGKPLLKLQQLVYKAILFSKRTARHSEMLISSCLAQCFLLVLCSFYIETTLGPKPQFSSEILESVYRWGPGLSAVSGAIILASSIPKHWFWHRGLTQMGSHWLSSASSVSAARAQPSFGKRLDFESCLQEFDLQELKQELKTETFRSFITVAQILICIAPISIRLALPTLAS